MLLVSSVVSAKSVASAKLAAEPKICNIKILGAVGDGMAKDTKPLQDAVDACQNVLIENCRTNIMGQVSKKKKHKKVHSKTEFQSSFYHLKFS